MNGNPSLFKQHRALLNAIMWALILSVAAISIARTIGDTELRKVIYSGAAGLLFGGLLGGVLKLLLDEVVAEKRRREDAAQFVANVLSDLKSVYDRVGRARLLIPAHKSVKTYGEEMRDMIESRVQLRNVMRALEKRAEGVDESLRGAVTRHIKRMEGYLDTLTSEFRDRYKELSDIQRAYEERAQAMLKRYAENTADQYPPRLPTFAWEMLTELPVLRDFIGDGVQYSSGFERPLDQASALLRQEHARILGSAGAASASSPQIVDVPRQV
jgi:hypothetical protein